MEVEYDATANYSLGDIFGSSVLLLHWKHDINDPITRNIISKYDYEEQAAATAKN